MSKKEARFQEYSFDPDLGGKRGIGELRKYIDGDELGEYGRSWGFQIKRFRTGYRKNTPEWAKTYEGVQKVLLTAFPKLHTHVGQRKRAARWAQVIYLYYFKDFSESQIAEELNTKTKTINNVILCFTYVSRGFTAKGKPRVR